MIHGIGVDTASVQRVARAYERFGNRFIHRITRNGELRLSPGHPAFTQELAAFFSLKEAVFKALRPSTLSIRFHEVEIYHLPGGAPSVRLHGRLAEHAEREGVGQIHVSISHEKEQAVTVAVALKLSGKEA